MTAPRFEPAPCAACGRRRMLTPPGMSVLCWEGEDLCQCPDALALPAPEPRRCACGQISHHMDGWCGSNCAFSSSPPKPPRLPPFTFSEWIEMRRALHVAKIYLGADGAYMLADALHQWLGSAPAWIDGVPLEGPTVGFESAATPAATALAFERLGEAARTFGQVQWLDALEGFTLERAQAAAAAEGRKP